MVCMFLILPSLEIVITIIIIIVMKLRILSLPLISNAIKATFYVVSLNKEGSGNRLHNLFIGVFCFSYIAQLKLY